MFLSSLVDVVLDLPIDGEHLLDPNIFLARPTIVPFTPEEPSTLSLALIGLGIVAIYALFARGRGRWQVTKDGFIRKRRAAELPRDAPKRSAA